MSKQSIEWHKQCFTNATASVEERRKDVARRTADLEHAERQLAFYAEQIEAAEKRGMASFDSERLLVKRQHSKQDR